MKRIEIQDNRVEYDPKTDILFVSFGDHDPSLIDREECVADGVYLQYSWPHGEPAFMEIWKFSKRYGSLPITLHICGDEELEVYVPEERRVFA